MASRTALDRVRRLVRHPAAGPRASTSRAQVRVPAGLVALIDAVAVVVFATVGRASHDESNAVVGVLITAWPFLAGAGMGWGVVYAVRRAAPVGPALGAVVWAGAVIGGMLLRQASGKGTAATFIVVATIALAVLLLGWRLLAGAVTRRRG